MSVPNSEMVNAISKCLKAAEAEYETMSPREKRLEDLKRAYHRADMEAYAAKRRWIEAQWAKD